MVNPKELLIKYLLDEYRGPITTSQHRLSKPPRVECGNSTASTTFPIWRRSISAGTCRGPSNFVAARLRPIAFSSCTKEDADSISSARTICTPIRSRPARKRSLRASGIKWRDYDRFIVKTFGDERLTKVPRDLDLKPYRDEQDNDLLRHMLASARAGKAPKGTKVHDLAAPRYRGRFSSPWA
jgi:hypothetical protein